MKRITRNLIIAAYFITSLVLSGCIEEKPAALPESNEEVTWRITASLDDSEPDTRLDYFESGKALKAYWSSDDQISASFRPGAADCTFILNLVEGAGTSTGVFETTDKVYGLTPGSIPSNAWTLYFPGNLIKCEEDYLNFSYMGQVQKGSGNTDHLKNYHTIRHMCTDGSYGASSSFKDAFIDFSGEDNNESSCMKIKLADLPSITPVNVALEYSAPSGSESKVFYLHNFLSSYWSGNYEANSSKSHKISIDLEDFGPSTDATVYLMMSNYPVELEAGGKLTISVKSDDDKLYTCTRTLKSDVTLQGGCLHSISGSSWDVAEVYDYDGLENPEEGIFVLQEASAGDGVDIIIMGDGFSNSHFGENGNYDKVMRQAYEDFFSIEPYPSYRDYFRISTVAVYSQERGATIESDMSSVMAQERNTVFSSVLEGGNSTAVSCNYEKVLSYALAVPGMSETGLDDAAVLLLINVDAYAGTCVMYASGRSVAMCPMGKDSFRQVVSHEGGGHGFGRLLDEYRPNEGQLPEQMKEDLVYWRKYDPYYGYNIDVTGDRANVHWAHYFSRKGYEAVEMFEGGYLYQRGAWRPEDMSCMHDNRSYYNAPSREAIVRRIMKASGKSFIMNDFIDKDKLRKDPAVKSGYVEAAAIPFAPPVKIDNL